MRASPCARYPAARNLKIAPSGVGGGNAEPTVRHGAHIVFLHCGGSFDGAAALVPLLVAAALPSDAFRHDQACEAWGRIGHKLVVGGLPRWARLREGHVP